MKKERTNERSEELGSIGIGAMIVFIALILVAAVASAVIIQTGEKLQQNAQQTGTDTQQEIGGKISIITIWVGDQTDCSTFAGADTCITMVFELAPGSDTIEEDQVTWTIICDDGAATPVIQTVFGTLDHDTVALLDTMNADTNTAKADDLLNPGNVYMINLQTNDATGGDDCDATLNEQHTLIISVEGGGSTYETLSYTSEDQGDSVV